MRTKRSRRVARDDHQLSLAIAWLSEDAFADAMHERGAVAIRRVRFKPNRSRMISLSVDRRSLNIHECFRAASSDVLDAVATFIRASARSTDYRDAVQRMRAWWDGQVHIEDHGVTNGLRPRACCATREQREFLARTYARLNATRFDGLLPDGIPIRLSNRMSRRFGHVYYGVGPNGVRLIEEIALNVDLMIEGNEKHLLDTLLHEMAHAEAWLLHGHREHGPIWRAVARRVGCEPLACSMVRIRRRRGARTPVTRVPRLALSWIPAPAKSATNGVHTTVRRKAAKTSAKATTRKRGSRGTDSSRKRGTRRPKKTTRKKPTRR